MLRCKEIHDPLGDGVRDPVAAVVVRQDASLKIVGHKPGFHQYGGALIHPRDIERIILDALVDLIVILVHGGVDHIGVDVHQSAVNAGGQRLGIGLIVKAVGAGLPHIVHAVGACFADVDVETRRALEQSRTLSDALLEPTKIYVHALKSVKQAGVTVRACSHITGGGFYENVPRMLREGTRAVIRKDSYEVPYLFRLLAERGGIDEHIMYNTYNMGIGMVLAVAPEDEENAKRAIREAGETVYTIGRIENGEKGVDLI